MHVDLNEAWDEHSSWLQDQNLEENKMYSTTFCSDAEVMDICWMHLREEAQPPHPPTPNIFSPKTITSHLTFYKSRTLVIQWAIFYPWDPAHPFRCSSCSNFYNINKFKKIKTHKQFLVEALGKFSHYDNVLLFSHRLCQNTGSH